MLLPKFDDCLFVLTLRKPHNILLLQTIQLLPASTFMSEKGKAELLFPVPKPAADLRRLIFSLRLE